MSHVAKSLCWNKSMAVFGPHGCATVVMNEHFSAFARRIYRNTLNLHTIIHDVCPVAVLKKMTVQIGTITNARELRRGSTGINWARMMY